MIIAVLAVSVVAGIACFGVKWNYTGGLVGIYVLSRPNALPEITDDLFPEDADRLMTGFDFPDTSSVAWCHAPDASCLMYSWNSGAGRGFIKNIFADGKKLVMNISRSHDGALNSGLFLGGGLPPSDPDYQHMNGNETGMAYFDGTRWFHIWCSVNEGISSLAHPMDTVYPSNWKFLGSQVLESTPGQITLRSFHSTTLEGVPLRIEKTFFYNSGDRFFTLVTKITNSGDRPLGLFYLYGDEPWVGNYGSSEGNVGWLEDGLVKTERMVEPDRKSYAGFFDYGNDAAGEKHTYTMKANFIEWEKQDPPEVVYFSNFIGRSSMPNVNGGEVPLASRDSRFIGLQWLRNLKPGGLLVARLAVGMADNDPKTGFPIKPPTGLNKGASIH